MASTVVTIRMDPALLAALKAEVRREGTTVSGAIVELVRAKVGPQRPRRRTPTMNMFAGQFDDIDLPEFTRARRELSARLLKSVQRPQR